MEKRVLGVVPSHSTDSCGSFLMAELGGRGVGKMVYLWAQYLKHPSPEYHFVVF